MTLVFILASFSNASGDKREPARTFVEKKLTALTLPQKIGQLLFVGFRGTLASEEAGNLIKQLRVGGLILFSHNIKDNPQVAQLTYDLQKASLQHGVPALIAIDQEGGKVARLRKNATVLPGEMALGATKSRELAFLAGQMTGQELRMVGINMNLAPVMDVERARSVSVIGVRSFGEDATLVSELGRYYISGLEGTGVLATAKHFPGHGEVSGDSHFTTPVCSAAEGEILSVDVAPYKKIIESSPPSAIMTAHVSFPSIDPTKVPATLSKAIITDMLRKRLHYDGLVITDDLEMRGVANISDPGEAAVKAVEAGADLLMVVWSPAAKRKVALAIYQAVRSGRITEERINASVRRILTAKYTHGLFLPLHKAERRFVETRMGSEANLDLAKTIARRAITVIKNEGHTIPLSPHNKRRILVVSPFPALGATISKFNPSHVDIARSSFNPSNEETTALLKRIMDSNSDDIVIGLATPAHVRLVQKLSALLKEDLRLPANEGSRHEDRRLIAVSFDSPRLLKDLDSVDAYVCTYSSQSPAPELVAKVLMGTETAQGSLPVTITPIDEKKDGYRFGR